MLILDLLLRNLEENSEASVGERAPASTLHYTRTHVLVIGDSLLRGVEAKVCQPDLFSLESCCLPAACIQDVSERVETLIKGRNTHQLSMFF